MLCPKPLKRLYNTLNGCVEQHKLIDACENASDVREFANAIAEAASKGSYDRENRPVNPLDAYDEALKFAAWWSYQ
jgi:hypothetical protein